MGSTAWGPANAHAGAPPAVFPSSWRKPGPITTGVCWERGRGPSFAQSSAAGVMGPGLRQDDTECTASPVVKVPHFRDAIRCLAEGVNAVSYTHLTLPTSD